MNMTNLNIKAAVSTLGITKSEAEVLDCMDGEKNGKIEQSIFDQAEEILSTVKTAKDGTVLKDELLNTPVAKAVSGTINKILDALKKKVQLEEVMTKEDDPNTPGIDEEYDLKNVVRDKQEDE